jgi:hypothetical protein
MKKQCKNRKQKLNLKGIEKAILWFQTLRLIIPEYAEGFFFLLDYAHISFEHHIYSFLIPLLWGVFMPSVKRIKSAISIFLQVF